MPAPVCNFHLPLPEPTYRRLRDAAERTNQPATAIARHAIETWLRQHRRSMVREEIARYAVETAGTSHDLDEDLEAAALERWRTPPTPRKPRARKR
jgi:hypothetical protein